ncbi:tRNA pseudouridine(38-40) synthase TruA [Croceicoccus sp. F390]|uniref:tRNA pseudouridine synthase A n=1 Tax=Croceicoccus esteveae TaxID=3075597 RepID=A0ABU2ZJ32_9SPHN|nr:tRNA pseudouridine(38-40) synthase TruA [Croceicoccus sp. F390]MDT0575579.1 tRNA pseudouridine(38-40) synthase TruA [Croceicoccus sp. F390]
MTRFALTLEFDGTPFMGLQRQKHGPSVQQAIETAAAAITQEDVRMQAAGRTDAGVHAIAMRAHIDVEKPLSAFQMMEALNARLRPQPIAVIGCQIVADAWHARFSCIERRYLYRICNRRAPLALSAGRAWQVAPPLDEEQMQAAAQILIGTHDFTTFRSVHCQSQSPVKSLSLLQVERSGEDIMIHAAARSFLHHQVRSMVGCVALVGMGRWTIDDLGAALAARNRQRLGLNAPAHGLYFKEAVYAVAG